jgi:uncharacterized Tic20 family protein
MNQQHFRPEDAGPPPPRPEGPYQSPPMGSMYPEVPPTFEENKDARTMGMLCHLTALSVFVGVPGFIGPLIIWLIRKDEDVFVDDQGKESLNFQITMLLVGVVIGLVGAITCGFGLLLFPALLIFDLVFCIIGTVKANDGQYYRYPINIRLIT